MNSSIGNSVLSVKEKSTFATSSEAVATSAVTAAHSTPAVTVAESPTAVEFSPGGGFAALSTLRPHAVVVRQRVLQQELQRVRQQDVAAIPKLLSY